MTYRTRSLFGAALLAGAALSLLAAAPPDEPKAAATKIKYADLGKLVRSHQGKIVVVDFWSTT